jgi:two-component system, OmpR family, sensor histidine kinase PhoQ
MKAMQKLHADRNVQIHVEGMEVQPAGEEQDLREMLGNLLNNAFLRATRRVWERPWVLERGAGLDESRPGHGLGLAIVQDLARLYEGALTLAEREGGGLSVTLNLPAALPRA